MDDIERIQAYILGRLDGDPQEKEDIITAINENRGDDRDIIETAFEELINRDRIQPGDENPPTYSLTEAGEVKMLFEGPAVMLAIDFVGVQNKDQLDAYLMDLYEVDETPEEMTTGGTSTLPLTSQEWGEIEKDRGEFDSFNLTVIQFNSVPLGYHVILSGKLTTDYFDAIWTADKDASLASARNAIRKAWSDIFDGFSLGLVSSHDDPVRLAGRNTPITLSTLKLGLSVNEALTGSPDVTDYQRLYRSYASHFGRRGFFEMLDIDPLSTKSVIPQAANVVCVVGSGSKMSPDNMTHHSSYTMIEISDQLVLDENKRTPPSALSLSSDFLVRFLPLLYLFNWFKGKQLEFWDLNESVRELSLSRIDAGGSIDDIQDDMEHLIDADLDFTETYSRVLFHQQIAENYFEYLTDWFKQRDHGEIPISDIRRIDDTEEAQGVFTTILDDIIDEMELVEENYEGLFDRYSVTATSLNRLLSYQSSATNIQINNTVKWLTVILVFLALFGGFGGYEFVIGLASQTYQFAVELAEQLSI
ncbi:hypothetical protein [Salinibaculum salinum]|uniref:hypothetical protein n=1 Tax=Salinibaculum salinum TaxID=3131996 RepID=UPI0030EBAC15